VMTGDPRRLTHPPAAWELRSNLKRCAVRLIRG
jgi:hypothetical protein